jgi:hypothetical protein
VGEEELVALAAHFAGKSQWVEAAKSRWAVFFVSSSQSVAMMDEVMELLEKCGPTRLSGALQLGVRGGHRSGLESLNSARTHRFEPNPGAFFITSSIYLKMPMLIGSIPPPWAGGKKVHGDSVLKAQRPGSVAQSSDTADTERMQQCWCSQGDTNNAERALEYSALNFEGIVHANKATVSVRRILHGRSVYHEKERGAVPSCYPGTDEHWGADCSRMMEVFSLYKFERHFQIARSTAFRFHAVR